MEGRPALREVIGNSEVSVRFHAAAPSLATGGALRGGAVRDGVGQARLLAWA